jgi:hypothetical protein
MKSRTAPGIAADLSLSAIEVRAPFEAFPGVFRRSKNTDSDGNSFYTIYARYALRGYDAASEGEEPELPPVRPEILAVLLEFITQAARGEREHVRFSQQLESAEASAGGAEQSANRAALVALLAAVLALIGSVVGAFLAS